LKILPNHLCCGWAARLIVKNRTAFFVAAIGFVIGQILWAAPRIDEGHNVFLIDPPGGGLERGLPTAAFQLMAAEFNTRYPPEHRCNPAVDGCWRGEAFPQAPYAFSADSIYDRRAMHSRRVTGIAFADPVWLRLGFINEKGYNWNSRVSDIDRAARNGGSFAFLHRWRITMPWFVSYRFPAEFVGSSLCWRGEVLWERAGERFDLVAHPSMQCRVLSSEDIGRRIFGVSIKEEPPLAMRLDPTGRIRFAQLIECGLALIAAAMVIGVLVRWRYRRAVVAFALIAATLVVVFLNDASFLGGVRPFDSGDDGLVYDGMARVMLRHLLGDIAARSRAARRCSTPRMRYLRMIEHTCSARRISAISRLFSCSPFWSGSCSALSAAGMSHGHDAHFVAIPIGVLFGSASCNMSNGRRAGSPIPPPISFSGGTCSSSRHTERPRAAFAVAWGAAFSLRSRCWSAQYRAPRGVLLAGSGIAALCQRSFAPERPLHQLSAGSRGGAQLALWRGLGVVYHDRRPPRRALVMPPSAYAAALAELIHFGFGGRMSVAPCGNSARRAARTIRVLSHGAGEYRRHRGGHPHGIVEEVDPWLRLTALATLINKGTLFMRLARYYYLTWLLTLLITTGRMQREGLVLFQRRFPGLAAQFAKHPARLAVARLLRQAAGA
jgi:hypothetical protein